MWRAWGDASEPFRPSPSPVDVPDDKYLGDYTTRVTLWPEGDVFPYMYGRPMVGAVPMPMAMAMPAAAPAADGAFASKAARMGLANDAVAGTAAEATGAGGGGGGGAGGGAPLRLQGDFRVTALFAVATAGADGVARVPFTAPANLGAFAVRAYAASPPDGEAPARYGSGEGSVVVRRPVSLVGSVPRIVRSGDAFEAGVIVSAPGEASEVTVSLAASAGGAPRAGGGGRGGGPPAVTLQSGVARDTLSVTVPARGQAEARFKFRASQVGKAGRTRVARAAAPARAPLLFEPLSRQRPLWPGRPAGSRSLRAVRPSSLHPPPPQAPATPTSQPNLPAARRSATRRCALRRRPGPGVTPRRTGSSWRCRSWAARAACTWRPRLQSGPTPAGGTGAGGLGGGGRLGRQRARVQQRSGHRPAHGPARDSTPQVSNGRPTPPPSAAAPPPRARKGSRCRAPSRAAARWTLLRAWATCLQSRRERAARGGLLAPHCLVAWRRTQRRRHAPTPTPRTCAPVTCRAPPQPGRLRACARHPPSHACRPHTRAHCHRRRTSRWWRRSPRPPTAQTRCWLCPPPCSRRCWRPTGRLWRGPAVRKHPACRDPGCKHARLLGSPSAAWRGIAVCGTGSAPPAKARPDLAAPASPCLARPQGSAACQGVAVGAPAGGVAAGDQRHHGAPGQRGIRPAAVRPLAVSPRQGRGSVWRRGGRHTGGVGAPRPEAAATCGSRCSGRRMRRADALCGPTLHTAPFPPITTGRTAGSPAAPTSP